MAFELGWSEWKLAFATAPADAPRLRSVGGRNTQAILQEIANAKKRFGLPEDAPVFCCYEAGRDGFWLHRWLVAQGYHNLVVDSSSIETKRRQRRAKNDRLDASKLVSMLLRYHGGEKKVWSAVQVPSVADEDRRQLHRDLLELKAERTQHVNRIKGLLAGCGLAVTTIDEDFPTVLAELRQWDGTPSSDNQVAPIFLAGSSRENGPSRPSRVLLRRPGSLPHFFGNIGRVQEVVRVRQTHRLLGQRGRRFDRGHGHRVRRRHGHRPRGRFLRSGPKPRPRNRLGHAAV